MIVSCDEMGFDCDYAATGDVDKIVFEYWDHLSKEHGIEYSPETLAKYVKKKLPARISAS